MAQDSLSAATCQRAVASLGPLSEHVQTQLERAASGSMPVLIVGETGTGKTYLAERIHQLSSRSSQRFLAVNLSTINPNLIEAELFGHERGAYTDAREARAGLVESANGSTLFLDEIADLPIDQQPKLLALFEESWIRRVGGTCQTRVDVRIICATSQDLADLIRQGRFRQDLYYRCCGLLIQLPPLRARRKQLPAIIRHILWRQLSSTSRRDVPSVDPEVTAILSAHEWPGNIRHLGHVLSLAALNSDGMTIRPEHLPEELLLGHEAGPYCSNGARTEVSPGKPGPRYKAPEDPDEERSNILRALVRSGGNKTQAARLLGMSRQVLWERIRLYRIRDGEWRHSATRALQTGDTSR